MRISDLSYGYYQVCHPFIVEFYIILLASIFVLIGHLCTLYCRPIFSLLSPSLSSTSKFSPHSFHFIIVKFFSGVFLNIFLPSASFSMPIMCHYSLPSASSLFRTAMIFRADRDTMAANASGAERGENTESTPVVSQPQQTTSMNAPLVK